MKKFRKTISLLLSFLFLLMLFPISSALAAGDINVEYAPTVFQQIRGITLDSSGGLYVCDGSYDRIKKYTSDGMLDTTFVTDGIFGVEPPNEINDARGICFDSSGNFYIGDGNGDRVLKFSSAGVQDPSFDDDDGDGDTSDDDGVVDGFGNVYDVAIGWVSTKEYIYVCDQYSKVITRYDISNGDKDPGFAINISGRNPSDTGDYFPQSIAIDGDNNIFVSVCCTDGTDDTMTIRKYDSDGSNLLNFGAGIVKSPAGLFIDSNDRIYVSDSSNHRVLRFKANGTIDNDFAASGILGGSEGSTPEQFKFPRDVEVDETNGYLYVADSSNYRIKKYILTENSGTTTCTLDTGFDGDGVLGDCRGSDTNEQLLQAEDVAACPDGGYIVADSNNDRVKKYTAAGVLDTSFSGDGILGQREEQRAPLDPGDPEPDEWFNTVGEVAVHPVNGNIYIVDRYNDAIKIFNTSGAHLSTITNATYMTNPRGLTVDNAGNVYVGDTTGNWVVKFNSGGNYVWHKDVVDDPYSIALDTDGTSIFVAVSGSATDHVLKLNNDGTLADGSHGEEEFAAGGFLADGFDSPRGVTVDSEGSVYVSDSILDEIKKYNPDGTADTSFGDNGKYSESRYDGDEFLDSPYGMAEVDGKLYIADRTNCRIVVLSNIGLISSDKKITSFVFESFDPDVTGTVNESARTVTLTVPHDTDVTSLSPTIAVSTNASVSPASGAAQNFTSPVDYTVTAEDNSQQVYAVTVNVAPDNDATLSDLTFGGSTVTGFASGNTSYTVTAAHDAATVTIGAATNDPNASASGTGTFAFSGNSQTYTVTVTAEDTVTQETYDINVTRLPDDDATLSDLSFNGSTVEGFAPGNTSYNVTTAHDATTVTIGATTTDTNASAADTGTFAFSGNSQTYTVTVTAEDATTQVMYDINVTRLPDDDATLSDLTIGGATVSGFNANTTSYNATADHHATTVTIGAATNDPNASASGTGTLAFTGNSQVYTVTVTAEDGTTQKTYSINVVRTPDDDATLSDLTVGGTTVSGFDAGTTLYNITVGHHASTVTIGAAPNDPNASVSGTGTLAFSGHSQTYTVTVTAEDTVAKKTYDINVTRAPDNDATLSDLSFNGSTVAGFAPGNTSYNVTAAHDATTVTVDATTADTNASASGTGAFVFSGNAQTYTVTVTAEDAVTQETYDINVTRAPDDDATLSDLTIGGATVSGFNANNTSYNATADHHATTVTIGAATNDPNASASGTGTLAFTGSSQNYTVTVTAEDGSTQKAYSINVARTPDDDATLSDLTVGGTTVSGFDAGTKVYNVTVGHHASTVTIGATPNDPNASVSGTGTLAFSGNSQTYTVTITAEDTTTQETYDINATRAPDNDATLSDLSVDGTTVTGFVSSGTDYTVYVDPSTTSVTIGAATADPNASTSGTGTFSFNGEAQTYTVTVTAEDGTTQKTYDVNVSRTLREDATLADLTFDSGTVSGFASNVLSYDITVAHDVASVTIGAITSDVNASVVGTGTFAFSDNTKTFKVTVTAEDSATKKTYTINVTRTPDDDATLSDLTVDGITLMNFDAADTEYNVSAAHNATTVTIGATTNDPNASASGTGVIPFSGNAKSYTVTVTAEDGSTSMSYTINITRADAPDDDSIVSITGTLLDENGNPLVGYTVELHSVPRSTVTDAQGKYTFENVEIDDHTLIVKDTSGDTVNTIGISIQSGEEFAWDKQDADIDVTIEDNTAMIDVTIELDGDGNIAVDDVEERENPETGGTGASWLILTIVLTAILAGLLVLLIKRIRSVKTKA